MEGVTRCEEKVNQYDMHKWNVILANLYGCYIKLMAAR